MVWRGYGKGEVGACASTVRPACLKFNDSNRTKGWGTRERSVEERNVKRVTEYGCEGFDFDGADADNPADNPPWKEPGID